MEIIDIDRYTVVSYAFTDTGLTYQEQHQAAVGLLRDTLYDCYGIRLEEKKIQKGRRGKPCFEDSCVSFNLTHARGLIACMICSNAEVGIDAEWIRAGRGKITGKFMTSGEIAHYESLSESEREEYMFRIWTLKEALSKAYGTGIDENFRKPEFTLVNGPACTDNSFWYYQWKVSDQERDYIISAALEK